jgi:ABC-type glutathione transport system ATPase component
MGTALPSRALLEVRELTISYNQRRVSAPVLQNLSFDLASGEVLGIEGPSGCGKTSLALAVLKLLPPSASVAGQANFAGSDLLSMSEGQLRRIRGEKISIIYQEPALALNPVLRVGDQIEEVLRAHRTLSTENRKQQVRKMLDIVGLGSTRFYPAYPHELSGGECHRVVLAQALICGPSLVIADEPTAGLDACLKTQILDVIDQIRKEFGTAFLLISHDRKVIQRLADRRLFLADNNAASSRKAPAEIAHRASPRDTDMLLSNSRSIPLIETRALGKRYTGRNVFGTVVSETQALDGVDLKIKPASICALIGASGSGKSTLASCLALLESVDSGEIWLQGQQISASQKSCVRQWRRRIQLVHQDPSSALNPRFSAAQAIEEPLAIAGVKSKRKRREQALMLMEQVGLNPFAGDRSCHDFSGGQKQRIAIARALSLNPQLLILDESLSGVDSETRDQLLELILRLKNTLRISFLLISHDLDQVAASADFVAVMHQGSIVEHRPTPELFSNPTHAATLDLLEAPSEKAQFTFAGAH